MDGRGVELVLYVKDLQAIYNGVVVLGLLTMLVGIEGGAVLFVAGLVVTLVAAVAALVVVAMT